MVKAMPSQLGQSPCLIKVYIFFFLPLDSKLDGFVFICFNCCVKRGHHFLKNLHPDLLNYHRLTYSTSGIVEKSSGGLSGVEVFPLITVECASIATDQTQQGLPQLSTR